MACCLFGADPLSDPVLDYCQLSLWEQTLNIEILNEIIKKMKKMYLKMLSAKLGPFCLGLDVSRINRDITDIIRCTVVHISATELTPILCVNP